MSLLIVKNIPREGPGILEDILTKNSIPHEIIDLDTGDNLPDPLGYSAIIVLGGPDSANDTTGKMITELAMVRQAIDAGIPYLGICLGMQALVKACGGSVYANDVKEIGLRGEDGNYYSVGIETEYADDPLFNGLESPVKIFHLHGETVKITEEMQLMGTGKYCRHQIIKVGEKAYGIQGHFELTPEMFMVWLDSDPELKEMDRETLMTDFESLANEYSSNGKILFGNFLKIAGVM
ncbi:type 1 glutamine amidotransferase [Methanolobus psychrotolerans]|uniref:type 1 glutamine amidotransferase n=1 Tax=Methanolobus psychrotolerans TaxID=1874706 RepID=UPI000B91B19E|nr:type 1 glutamine amidotransferase [Methanolobus psychrotolerans]